ncbi:MAG: hypothetical protein FWB91_05390 [Defluviitaleaceae bacterium]|nr:hypothetical protein [Defluviitaleaceae bacterium]
MASVMSNEILRELRKRKRMRPKDVIKMLDGENETNNALAELTVLRAESLRQKLRAENVDIVMNALKMPVDTFFCPCLDTQTTGLLQQKNTLMHYMAYAEEDSYYRKKAIDLINQLKKAGLFSEGVNYQFLLSQEIRIQEALEKNPSKIRELIFEGLSITYPEVKKDEFSGEVLIFEEASLFHSLALTYKREGNTKRAIELLHDILTGLVLLSQDDRDKERMLAPIFLTLAECYIEEKNFAEAMKACDDGYQATMKRNSGLHAPDFVQLKAYCHAQLGEADKSPPLLTQAYAGYSLLRRYSKADELLPYVTPHGMESIRPPMPEPIFSYGKPLKCSSIGELFEAFRYDEGLSLKDVCEGICQPSTLFKIETGKTPGNVYHLEAIMERFGRDIDKYFYTFLPYDEFGVKQLRDKIWSLAVNAQYAEVSELLSELEKEKRFKSGVGLQFVKLIKAQIYKKENGVGTEHVAKLNDALTTTRENFDLEMVARTRLSRWEVITLNQMANSLCASGNSKKGLRLFEDLKESMDRYYVDESAKMLMYTTILYNYSKYLGLAERYKEALEFAHLGEELDVKHCKLKRLPGFAINRAWCMSETGYKEKCLPYFAQAYYGSRLLGKHGDANAIISYAKEKKLGISF